MSIEALVQPDSSFERLARILRDAIGAPIGLISIIDAERPISSGVFALAAPPAHPRHAPWAQPFCQQVVASGVPLIVSDARRDVRLRDYPAVHDLKVIGYAGYPLRDADGHVIGVACAIDTYPREWAEAELRVLEDIAQVASSEFQLRASAATLARSYEQLTMFAGQISHDLKSPLGAILGFVDLIKEEIESPRSNDRMTGYVDRCGSSARRMARTIDELLAYSTVGGALRTTDVSLDAAMHAVVDDLGADVGDADITWTDETVFADPVQLRCLLQNLVGNAVKFAVRDRTPRIVVSAARYVTHVEIRIADNGPGIPPERRDEVLRPMVRLRRDVPGSGLGLATCDRIATAHNGLVQISGTPGGGTTVVVQFPHNAAAGAARIA